MIADYLDLSVDELLAEEFVQAYLLGSQTDAQWAQARRNHPPFDARLREADTRLAAFGQVRDGPATASDSPAARQILTGIDASIDSKNAQAAPQLTPLTTVTVAESTEIVRPEPRIIPLPRTTQSPINRRIYLWAAVIAAALLLLFWLQPRGDRYSTAPGQSQLVHLPDSSAVWLAPDSKLVVEEYTSTRNLRLEGEAFFQVKPGPAFTIQTSQGQVSVLGTSFRVEASPSALHVRCQTGRVAIIRNNVRVELTAGKSVRSEGAGLGEVRRESPSTEPAPGAAVIVARNVRVEELGARLGRYYARSVTVAAGLADRRLTIELPTDDLAETTRRLAFVLRVNVDTSAGQLNIGM